MEYFKDVEDGKKIECITCGKKLSAINKHNIVRHYKAVHKLDINIGKRFEQLDSTEPLAKKNKLTVKIDIDKNEFLKCCVGLVAVKNMPFRIFDDREFFKTLIKPYEHAFQTNLNSKNIVTLLESSTFDIKDILKKRFKNQMVSLKIDIATRMERCILGINVQYIKDFSICINTLGKYKNYLNIIQNFSVSFQDFFFFLLTFLEIYLIWLPS